MPRLGRARPTLRSAALIVALMSLSATLTGCAQEFQHRDRNVSNAASFLREADRHFLTEMKQRPVNLSESARCYFAVREEQIDGTVYCGAARSYGGGTGQVWWKVRFTPKERGGEVRLTAPALASERPVTRPDRELVRPNGGSPPRRLDRLAAPKAPPGKPGMIIPNGTAADIDQPRRPGKDGVLRGPTYQIEVRRAGHAAAVSRPDGPVAPAPGETLYALDLSIGDGVTPPDQEAAATPRSEQTTYSLVSGNRRRDITDALTGRERAVVAISAPTSAEPRLEVTVDGVAQALSLASGERVAPEDGERAAAYYRAEPSATLDKTYRKRETRGDFRFAYTARYGEATLTPYSAQYGWAPAGSAWLMVSFADGKLTDEKSQRFDASMRGAQSYALRMPPPPSGSPTASQSGSPTASSSGSPAATPSGELGESPHPQRPQLRGVLGSGDGVIVFQVPDDFSEGDLVATPTFAFSSSEASPASGAVTMPTKRYAVKISG